MIVVNPNNITKACSAPVNRKPLSLTRMVRAHGVKDLGSRVPPVTRDLNFTARKVHYEELPRPSLQATNDAAAMPGAEASEMQEDKPVMLIPRVGRRRSEGRQITPAASADHQVLNLWTPTPAPATLHRKTPMAAYDINTKLPFHVLETAHIRMEPFVVSCSAHAYFSG
jgi:hypothetical protein